MRLQTPALRELTSEPGFDVSSRSGIDGVDANEEHHNRANLLDNLGRRLRMWLPAGYGRQPGVKRDADADDADGA